jgi:hypothetical protein
VVFQRKGVKHGWKAAWVRECVGLCGYQGWGVSGAWLGKVGWNVAKLP